MTGPSPMSGRTPVDLLIHSAAEVLTCRAEATGVRGAALAEPERVPDGAVAVDNGVVVDVGPSVELAARYAPSRAIDATGSLVSPGLVDSHSHLVHAGTRHAEWGRLVAGAPYAGLAGGIAHTRAQTAAASSESLRRGVAGRLDTMLAHGTTTVEAKSGYGRTPVDELRLLQVLDEVAHPVDMVRTYLGAHVAPSIGSPGAYVTDVVAQLDAVTDLVEYCDVCCDPVGFTPAQCRTIAEAAASRGLGVRVHADQTGAWGGAELAIEVGAASADHLELASDRAIELFGTSMTAATLLPGVSHHMMSMVAAPQGSSWTDAPHPDLAKRARRLVDAGALMVLASDYNPGSSPNLSMQTVMQLAARLYRLGYGEIWHMCTINAAVSLGRGHLVGSIEPGKRADLVVWDVPGHELVINQFGSNLVRTVVKSGVVVSVPSLGVGVEERVEASCAG